MNSLFQKKSCNSCMVHEDAGGSNVKVLCFCGSTLWVIIGGFWFMVVNEFSEEKFSLCHVGVVILVGG